MAMRAFTEPLKELYGFRELTESFDRQPGIYGISGCVDAQKSHIIYGFGNGSGPRIIVAFCEQRARELLEEYRFYDREALYFPARDILFYQSDIRGNALTRERMKVCEAILTNKDPVIVTTMDALMDPLIPPEEVEKAVLHFVPGEELDQERISGQLIRMGYEKEYQAEAPGQFAVRGGILDVYPLTAELPFRIELWGDEIDSIRSYSPESQRSLEPVEGLDLYPASEIVLSEERLKQGLSALLSDGKRLYDSYRTEMKTEEAFRIKETLGSLENQIREMGNIREAEAYLSYFYEETVSLTDYISRSSLHRGKKPLVFVDEFQRCLESAGAVELEFTDSMKQRLVKGYVIPGQMNNLFSLNQTLARLQMGNVLLLSSLETRQDALKVRKSFSLAVRSINAYNGSFSLLVKDLTTYKKGKSAVILVCGSQSRARRLADDLRQEGLSAFYTEDKERIVQPGETMVLYGKLRRGFSYPDIKFVVLTDTDIFGAERKKKKHTKRYEGERISDFAALKPGDYVVHENHGLGIFRGIEKIEIDHALKDYMKIEYDKGSTLYVLATQSDQILKYAGSDAAKPKLNRLGGQEWTKTRNRVQKAVTEVAQELVELYAVRQSKEGYQYNPDTPWQREFEEMFPFEETEDQLRAIAATKEDMESKKIMDRLICGDVGFGKTEIAIRAAFKAVQENKQVVYLVPTTILAQQHYNTFLQRMKDFPINIELLCRFRTAKEQRESIARLKNGLADIVIGTHRVLSKDVEFRNLGLLIIDEEQRFGVSHKEKIKQMKKDVDVLTLTATPIPRTLHMSLIGIRDMSVLEEAPSDRMAVQTYVMEYSDEMVREAITRELARDGQVYYVFNRVKQIRDITDRIRELVPDATVAYAHGQMSERELEDVMYAFINREIDVLVSTTIIETGLDISNANTMIIHDADNMGLSQLYQLRGRIGRSNRTSYAFLMYRRNKLLKEVAEKRLTAIREFSELGSGIRIAMKDLEIRGAGTVLGEAQHGHMEAVGYDLYCKMLNTAVKEAKGIPQEEEFETTLDLTLDAYIPPAYIGNESQKLDIYRRIASILNEEERDEILDELIDRFGEPPKTVQNLLTVALLKARAHGVYITEIKENAREIRISFLENARLDPAGLPLVMMEQGATLKLVPDKTAPMMIWQKQKNSRASTEILNGIIVSLETHCLQGKDEQ